MNTSVSPATSLSFVNRDVPGTLADQDIRFEIEAGGLQIKNKTPVIQPSSVDLHLGENFSIHADSSPFRKRLLPAATPLKCWTPVTSFLSPRDQIQLVQFKHLAERLSISQTKLDSQMKECKFDLTVSDLFLILHGGDCVLAHTQEHITLSPRLRGVVHGKSRFNRLFVSMNAGGGYIDPGFSGQITLGIQNESPHRLILQVGMPICQIEITRLVSPAERPYGHPELGSSYQNSTGAVAAR